MENSKAKDGKAMNTHAEREEKVLEFWKKNDIFRKSLNKVSPKGEFVFYEGPPTANGRPGIHHLEARAFKDAIPRYKTMRGFHVRRKSGWDTHGLPVELQVEKELGLKSKKDIEAYGIEAFNEKCKESVWTYVSEWRDFTERMGYWIDLKKPYITYKPEYIESVWKILEKVNADGLLYKDYKVVPWCPRCGTALSSHELAQGYEDVKDLAVTVKLKIDDSRFANIEGNAYFLAWTTTPWTLPGNVALAIGADIEYAKIKVGSDSLILAKSRLSLIKESYEIEKEFKGKDLIGLKYEPLYLFLRDNVSDAEKDKLKNAYKVYAADFVTTEEGTGIVHIAPMYGQDDFELGTKVGLPKYHLVNEDGTFKKETGFLAGKFVKDETTDVDIIKDLSLKGLLFHKEKHGHSYPFCWRCKTPLIYFARDSWYIAMSKLRNKLVKENEGIHWEPEHIKEGRFGEWLREVKDWSISRERYWGTPLPIWICQKCRKIKAVGSVAAVSQRPRNNYLVIRHGEAENNVKEILDSEERDRNKPSGLTDKGIAQVEQACQSLMNEKIDLILVSPLTRTRQTADILKKKLGWKDGQIVIDERIREMGMGEWNGRSIGEFYKNCPFEERFIKGPTGGENYADIKKRMGDFLYDLEARYQGKNILIISHETPIFLLMAAASGMDRERTLASRGQRDFIGNAEVRKMDFCVLPHNHEYELDLHRPYIDEVQLTCVCGGEMRRVKEVMDVWFDSGSMPFAQDHTITSLEPEDGRNFETRHTRKFKLTDLFHKKPENYPADFISEAVDQTRGWFYTLHAIGTLAGEGRAFKNVICLGHVLDAEGKKMSKSLGNVVNPWDMMNKYGADALRFWMYSINQPGESKNFEEKTVDEIVKKIFNLTANVAAFYKLYYEPATPYTLHPTPSHIIDKWIISRLNQLIENITTNLDDYVLLEPARAIRDFISDLSQWYLRRSRDRFKGDDVADKEAALATIHHVLINLAKIMAPFTPFFAEYLYREAGGQKESVHLEDWPEAGEIDGQLLKNMRIVRDFASKGLEARMTLKINVRQPLQTLRINGKGSTRVDLSAFLELLKDEVNVKEIIFDESIEKDVELDGNITPELKEEGRLRELLRKIQDLRKERGLTVGDKASLVVTDEYRSLVDKYSEEIKKTTGLMDIEIGDVLKLL